MPMLSSDIMAPGYAPFGSRFGSYTINPYLLGTGYAGTPDPVPGVPSPAPAPAPSPGPGGSGAGGQQQGQPGGGLPGSVPPGSNNQGAGNAGNSGNAGSAGDYAGHPGRDASGGMLGGNAAGNGGGMLDGTGGWSQGSWSPIDPYGGIDIGQTGSGILGTLATLAPGWAGIGLGALQAGMRGYNTINTNTIRGTQGIPDTDFGQFLGSILGLNNYGGTDGNRTIANPSQYGDLQRRIDASQLGNDPFASLFRTNTLGAPTAETLHGDPYTDGPGGLLGLLFGGPPTPAASVQTTSDQLSGQEAVKMLAEETGMSLAQAQALLDRDKPGNAAGGQGASQAHQVYSAPIGPTISGAPMASTPLTQHQIDKAASLAYQRSVGLIGGGGGTNGQSGNKPTGMGGNGFSGNLSAGAGNAVSAGGTGGLQNGFGGGGYARGGFVRGRPDNIPDNRRIAANEGEYVVRNAAAKVAGRRLLGMLNTPAGAARLRGMLG